MADLSKITELIDEEIAQAQRDAHELGFLAGYNKGHKEGLKQGYDNGINEVEAYHVGYDEGYKAGKEITKAEKEQIYNHGLDAAWECARKICTNWCLSDKSLNEIFGDGKTIDDIMKEYPASEAMTMIKEYEEKQTKHDKCCESCKYETLTADEEPCNNCGNLLESFTNWTPKKTEKSCDNCEHGDDTDSVECYECVKDIQNHFEEKQIENDCEYREICLTNGTFVCRECQNKSNYIPKPYIGYIPYHSKIKTEYDEETRSYVYTVEDNDDEISIDQAIDNLKKGYGIPYKHKTLTLAIKALRMMKEKSPIEQAYADAERNV